MEGASRTVRRRGRTASHGVSMTALCGIGCGQNVYPPPIGTVKTEPRATSSRRIANGRLLALLAGVGGIEPSLQVSVMPASEPLPNAPGNVLREKAESVTSETLQLVWEKPRELWVMHNPEMRLEYSVSQVGDITIAHTTTKLINEYELTGTTRRLPR
jgi:hypothetical protein